MKNLGKYLFALSLSLSVGCSAAVESQPAQQRTPVETSKLALTVDLLGGTDLGGVRYTVTQVDCATGLPIVPAYIETADVDLADMYIPGGNGTFENSPYDPHSQHHFADQYFDLAPGCYDVLAEPLQENGDLSKDCWSAHQDAVEVFASTTTEIHLIMQCRGEDNGGLDVIASANHPPHIGNLEFDPSKFTCEENTTVCITVTDSDADPVMVKWDIEPSAQIVSTTTAYNAAGELVECATISAPDVGTFQASATAFDMGYDAHGNLVPIEELLAAQGDPHPSRATLRFPIHRLSDKACIDTCECPEGFEVNAAGDACERTTITEVTESETIYRVCEGNRIPQYTAGGAQFPGGLIVPNAFFGQNWATSTNGLGGRLNQVGVWACDEEVAGRTQFPVGEWIGFATCIDIPEDGDYLVGMAADNNLRFSINGNLAFSLTNGNTSSFNYWWMNPIHLSAGAHTILLEGLNNGSEANFGAEIYGPFPAGSLTNDAAMAAADVENNIVFSTLDMLGGVFTTGESSGYSCPSGSSIDVCVDQFTCVEHRVTECREDGGVIGPIEETIDENTPGRD